MSKIDIDKFFRDQFQAHERNSASYRPEHWKNFEQLLDKSSKKRNRWGFSLNNLLFFMSSFVLVMLIPLLFLHSDTIMKPEDSGTVINKTNIEKTSSSVNKESSSTAVELKTKENSPISNVYIPLRSSLLKETAGTNSENKISNADLNTSDAPVNKTVNDFDLYIPVMKIQMFDNSSALTIINPPIIKNKKQNDINSNTKKGKIHRSQVLKPELYYNGF